MPCVGIAYIGERGSPIEAAMSMLVRPPRRYSRRLEHGILRGCSPAIQSALEPTATPPRCRSSFGRRSSPVPRDGQATRSSGGTATPGCGPTVWHRSHHCRSWPRRDGLDGAPSSCYQPAQPHPNQRYGVLHPIRFHAVSACFVAAMPGRTGAMSSFTSMGLLTSRRTSTGGFHARRPIQRL